MRQLLNRTVDFVVEHNYITLLVLVLLTGLVGAGIPQLDTGSQAGADAESFEDLDRVQASQYIEENYGNLSESQTEKTVQSVYVWKEDSNVLTKDSLLTGLQYQQEITAEESVQTALHEDGVRGIENLVATRAADDENATLAEQVRALENTSPAEVERLVEQTLAEEPRAQQFLPTGHGDEASSSDRRMFVAIDTDVDDDTRDDAGTVLYDTAQEHEDDGVFVTNSVAVNNVYDHFFSEMVELVLPISLLVILSVLVFSYRDVVDVVVGMTGVVLSVVWMFGLLGWFGIAAGVISIIPVVLISGLSIDFGFHVFNRYRELRGPDDDIREPMGNGVRLVGTALVLVTVTASIGFLANLTNPLPLIRNLGVSITLGVIAALVIFVTAVPALKITIDSLLERLGLDRRKGALGHGTYLRPVLERSVTLARRAAPAVLVIAVLVGAVGGVAWTNLGQENFQQSDGDVAEWKEQLPEPVGWEQHDFWAKADHAETVYQPASSDDAMQSQILVDDDVTADSTLEDIDAGVSHIEAEGLLVTQTSVPAEQSPTTAMAQVAQENEEFATVFQQADTDGNGVPDQNLESVYDAFYEADSQTAERVLERSNGEYESLLVTLSLTADRGDADDAVPTLDAGADMMTDGDERTATVAGALAVSDATTDKIIGGILQTMVIALLAIAVALAGVFKYMHDTATLGAVVTVPIALVVGLVIGGMALLDVPLTLLTALLMSLVIGLGVDYNIHIGDRFADELDAGKSPVAALRAAVTGTGGALLGSTLTSAGAFASIALVPHPQMQSFGSIVVIALVTSFLVSILVLPSVLLLWSRYSPAFTTAESPVDDPLPQD